MPVPTSNQGAESKRSLVPLLANLETLGAGGPQPQMPTSSELRFAMNSGATSAPTPRSRRCLRIA